MAEATPRLFRMFVAASVIFDVGALIAAFVPGYSQELGQAFAYEPAPLTAVGTAGLYAISAAALIAVAASIVGLYSFKRWGRTLSLGLTVASLLLYPLLGPQLESSLEAGLTDTGLMLYSAALAMAYYVPAISERFASDNPAGK